MQAKNFASSTNHRRSRKLSLKTYIIIALLVIMFATMVGIVLNVMQNHRMASFANTTTPSVTENGPMSDDAHNESEDSSSDSGIASSSENSGSGSSSQSGASGVLSTAPTSVSSGTGGSTPVAQHTSDDGVTYVAPSSPETTTQTRPQSSSGTNNDGAGYVPTPTGDTQSEQTSDTSSYDAVVEPPSLENADKDISFVANHEHENYHAHDDMTLNEWEDGYYVCHGAADVASDIRSLRPGDIVRVDGMTCVVEYVVDTDGGMSFEGVRNMMGWDVVIFHTATGSGSGRIRLVGARPTESHMFGVWYKGTLYSRQDWLSR